MFCDTSPSTEDDDYFQFSIFQKNSKIKSFEPAWIVTTVAFDYFEHLFGVIVEILLIFKKSNNCGRIRGTQHNNNLHNDIQHGNK